MSFDIVTLTDKESRGVKSMINVIETKIITAPETKPQYKLTIKNTVNSLINIGDLLYTYPIHQLIGTVNIKSRNDDGRGRSICIDKDPEFSDTDFAVYNGIAVTK